MLQQVCIREGSESTLTADGKCMCRPGYGGKRCGLPHSVLQLPWMAEKELVAGLQVRKKPRRLILVINDFFYDFDMLELSVRMLADLVEVFIIGEAEIDYGDRKNDTLVAALQRGYLQEDHHKLVYVNISHVSGANPLEKLHATTDGGLRLLSDIRPDDILIFSNPEQLFSRDFLMFLKIFHNYPQPVICQLDKYLHGLYWKVINPTSSDNEIIVRVANNFDSSLKRDHNAGSDAYHLRRRGKRSAVANAKESPEKDEYSEEVITTPSYNNILYVNRFGESSIAPGESGGVCGVSVHVFSTVFNNKVMNIISVHLGSRLITALL